MAEEGTEKISSLKDAFAQAESQQDLSDGWDTGMADDGQIVITKKTPVQSKEVFTKNEQTPKSEQKTETPKPVDTPNPWEKRFKDTQRAYTVEREARIRAEATVDQLEKRLSRLEDLASSNSRPNQEPNDEVDFEEAMADPNLFKKFLNSEVQKAVKEGTPKQDLPPQVQEALEEFQIQRDLRNLFVEEGNENVLPRLPVMKTLLEVYPDASFRQLYDAATKLESLTSQSGSNDGGGKEEGSAQSAQGEADPEDKLGQADGTAKELLARAEKLRTEKSTPGSLRQEGTKPKTVRDAVNQAIDVLDLA